MAEWSAIICEFTVTATIKRPPKTSRARRNVSRASRKTANAAAASAVAMMTSPFAATALVSYLATIAASRAHAGSVLGKARFEPGVDKKGARRLKLVGPDGDDLLVSLEVYRSHQAMAKGRERLRNLIASRHAFEFLSEDGRSFFTLNDDGEVVAKSPPFRTIEELGDAFIETNSVASPIGHEPYSIGSHEVVKPLTQKAAMKALDSVPVAPRSDDPYYETFNTDEAGAALDVSRQTVTEWARTRKLVALPRAKRGLRIPKAQIRDGKIAPGLQDLADVVDSPEALWSFLVRPIAIDGKPQRPLDLLFGNKADRVARIAAGRGDHFG